MKDLITKN